MNLLREIRVPQESVNDESVTVIRTSHAHGSQVTAGDVVVELETSNLNISLEAEVDGFVYYSCKEGDEIRINELLFVIADAFVEGYAVTDTQAPANQPASETFRAAEERGDDLRNRPGKASLLPTDPSERICDKPGLTSPRPAVTSGRRLELASLPPDAKPFSGETAFSARALELLATHAVSQSAFKGHDLVTSEDVLAYLQPARAVLAQPDVPSPLALPGIIESTVTRKRISRAKKREIDYLRQVQQAGLNSIVNIEFDTHGILAATGQHSKYFKHSLLPVIIYEAARLLRKYPQLNAFYLEQEVLFYNDVNIGVAIDIDDGLKTICIRQSDSLALRELEDQLFLLSNKYVDRTLSPSDLSDITFTITDLSAEGIHFFSPLINRNNSAILGIAAPKANGAMILTLAFDHRVTEGRTASGFLRELKERLEDYKNRLAGNSPNLSCFRCRKLLGEDFSGFGFLKIVNKEGIEKLLCQTCFKGL